MKLVAIVQPTYQGLTKQFSAYSPDIPGCIAKGPTEKKALETLKAIITTQIQTLEGVGMEPPQNSCKVEILDIETKQSQPDDDVFASVGRFH
jgi:predicted RNase H-like HicB family nuclease